jgi:hypothetical protein
MDCKSTNGKLVRIATMPYKRFTWMGCKRTHGRPVRNSSRCADRYSPGWAVKEHMDGQEAIHPDAQLRYSPGWAVKYTWKACKKFIQMCRKIFTCMGCKSLHRRTVRNSPICAVRFLPGWAVKAQMEGRQEIHPAAQLRYSPG